MKPVPPVTKARNATTGHRVFRITTCRRSTPSTREILRCVRGFRPMMQFARVVDVYEKIEATTKRLEMTELLVGLLRETPKEDLDKVVYLTRGRIHPDSAGSEVHRPHGDRPDAPRRRGHDDRRRTRGHLRDEGRPCASRAGVQRVLRPRGSREGPRIEGHRWPQ